MFLSESNYPFFFSSSIISFFWCIIIIIHFPFVVTFFFRVRIHVFFFPFIHFVIIVTYALRGEVRVADFGGISDIVSGSEIRAKHWPAEDIQAGQIEFLTKFANKLYKC